MTELMETYLHGTATCLAGCTSRLFMVPVRRDSLAACQDVMARKAVWRKECEQVSSQPDSGLNCVVVKPSFFYGKGRMICPSRMMLEGIS